MLEVSPVFSHTGLKAVLFRFEFGEVGLQLLDLSIESVYVRSGTIGRPGGRRPVLDLGKVDNHAHPSVIAWLPDQPQTA